MRVEDAIRLMAAELDVFHLEADAEGNYATRLPDGLHLRILRRPGEQLIVEAQLFPKVEETIRNPDLLRQLLLENLARSILRPGTLTHLRDLNEIALSRVFTPPKLEEEALVEQLDDFLQEARELARRMRDLFAPAGALPANPHGTEKK
jgi:hypothetical protein